MNGALAQTVASRPPRDGPPLAKFESVQRTATAKIISLATARERRLEIVPALVAPAPEPELELELEPELEPELELVELEADDVERETARLLNAYLRS